MRNFLTKHKADVIVISSILLIAIVVLTLSLASRREGGAVIVTVDGVTVGEFSLDKNATYNLNGGTNVLIIENGYAYLSYADCPDRTCVKTGKIKYSGQSIICLPNKLTVTVTDGLDGGVDLVS